MSKPKDKHTKIHQWRLKAQRGEAICEKCQRTDHITVDHIIPLSIIEMLGIDKEEHYNDEANFQYLCRWCNIMKANRLDHLNPKTIPLLEQYVKRYKDMLSTPNHLL